MTVQKTTTVKEMAENMREFHSSITIPFAKTSMTIPPILYYAISTKHADVNKYFKELSNRVKNKIIREMGVSQAKLVGKLSTKVQEIAWCELIHNTKKEDIDYTDFEAAKVIAYSGTTLTLPNALYMLIVRKFNGDERVASKHIKDVASTIKSQIEAANPEVKLKGKVSHKIQENLWLEFLTEKTKSFPVEVIK